MSKKIKRLIKSAFRKLNKFIWRCIRYTDKHYFSNKIIPAIYLKSKSLVSKGLILTDDQRYMKNGQIIDGKYSYFVEVPTKDLVLMQYACAAESDRYIRYELPVRYMAIEQMNNQNDFGQDWDDRLQIAWTGSAWRERFEKLVKSVKDKGYDDYSCFCVDKNMHLMDGSHRLALALYYEKEFVKVQIVNEDYDEKIGITHNIADKDFLFSNVFSTKELQIIEAKLENIIDGCLYPFYCILWPSARHLWTQITRELDEIEPTNLKVKDWRDIVLSGEELEGFYKMVYALDDVLPQYLKMKSDYVFNSSKINDDVYPVRVIRLDIKHPHYRVKPHSGLPQSREIIRYKEMFREKYKSQVYDYKRDVIIHIADNYLQSKFIGEIVNMNRDISDLYETLFKADLNVAIIKRDKYFDAPSKAARRNQFVFGTDIDFLTTTEDFQKVLSVVAQYAQRNFIGEWRAVKQVVFDNSDKKHRGSELKLLLHGVIVFSFHIQAALYDLTEDFIKEALSHKRLDNNKYVLDQPQYEVYLRLADAVYSPQKKHHRQYIHHYGHLVTDEGLHHAFDADGYEKAKSTYKEIMEGEL